MVDPNDTKPGDVDPVGLPVPDASHATDPVAAIATAKARADALVAEIEGHAQSVASRVQEIEQNRTLAAKGKGEIDGDVAALLERMQQLTQQLEAAKAAATELNDLHTAAQTAGTQTAETAAQAATALEAIRGVQTSATAVNTELNDLRTAAQTAGKQAAETATQASSALELIRGAQSSATAVNTELSDLRTAAQTAGTQTAETAAQAKAALEAVRGVQNSATEAANKVEALRVQVEQTAGVAATRSEHIEQGRVHADDVRAKIDNLFTQTQQSATNAEAQHQASRATLENVNAVYAAAQTSKANIDSLAEAITALRNQCDKHTDATKRLADTADGLDANIKASQAKLGELEKEAVELLKRIDDLLVGATNAGLGFAFEKRGSSFKTPEKVWQWVFVGALAVLFILAIVETVTAASKVPEYSELARMLLQRLPFVVPLVWLAIHASRQASLAKRMEEEYAFKATMSLSFEGYRRQMAEISENLAEGSPLARLCTDTIRTISSPPGRVYDKHRMDPTPATAAAEVAVPVVDRASKVLAALPKLPGAGG